MVIKVAELGNEEVNECQVIRQVLSATIGGLTKLFGLKHVREHFTEIANSDGYWQILEDVSILVSMDKMSKPQ